MKKRNIPIQNSYLKYISGVDLILAEIGFGVQDNTDTTWLSGNVRKEEMAPAMCIAMPFTGPFETFRMDMKNYLTMRLHMNGFLRVM